MFRIALHAKQRMSFPIRTIPSVPEFHRVGLPEGRFMDYTIGLELHHAPKTSFILTSVRIIRRSRFARKHDCVIYSASIVETDMVISSSTLMTIFTVSREVNTVTPLSVAQRRIMEPSLIVEPEETARVFRI